MTIAHLTLELMNAEPSPNLGSIGQTVALMNAQNLPASEDDAAPEWIHLLPSGDNGKISTDDSRGPYYVTDPDQIILNSFAESPKLPIDENHAIDRAAPRGEPAPARGWITEMQARDSGIWGKVEWTPQGARLVKSRAYLGISPAIGVGEGKRIGAILRASLVNTPNLSGMAALHNSEGDGMNFREMLIKKLGLAADADDAAIMAKLEKMMNNGNSPELQSSLDQVSVALGLPEGTGGDAVVAAAKAAKAGSGDASKDGLIAELQSSVTALTDRLAKIDEGNAAAASEAFYDKALNEKRAGVGPASKDYLISLHQSDPDAAVKFVEAMPKLGDTATTLQPPAPADGELHLNDSQRAVAQQLGMSEEDYAKQLKAEQEAG
ncbi:MAG: phage protease [Pseudomonadota bacterium]